MVTSLAIWNLPIHAKVKSFVWRVCHGCLPTRFRLQTKGVQCPISYVLCDNNIENT
uniref:Reverse transcriptase zinc-binding domain-containing protein n=1 Tax=Cajanus cajan TaxID=3821 RepID=A0A151TWS9_CAJCA|nr:hypothetical protein KK1_010786 [Cajanus cajan]